MLAVSILMLALVLELVVGEPPARLHPVMWMGWCISTLEAAAPSSHRGLYGAFSVLLTAFLFGVLGLVVWRASTSDSPAISIAGMLIAAYLLKSTFAVRSLGDSAAKIRAFLAGGDMNMARTCLSGVVSRNYVDTVVSPVFYYVVLSPFGLSLAGALVFKTVSTFDSRWGYRGEKYGKMGWLCAKLDDALNFIPARLSVLFVMLSSMSVSRAKCALREALRGHKSTPSPNSGWSMAAYAGVLGVKLEKQGVYALCPDMSMPSSEDIPRCVRLMYLCSALLFALAILALLACELC